MCKRLKFVKFHIYFLNDCILSKFWNNYKFLRLKTEYLLCILSIFIKIFLVLILGIEINTKISMQKF